MQHWYLFPEKLNTWNIKPLSQVSMTTLKVTNVPQPISDSYYGDKQRHSLFWNICNYNTHIWWYQWPELLSEHILLLSPKLPSNEDSHWVPVLVQLLEPQWPWHVFEESAHGVSALVGPQVVSRLVLFGQSREGHTAAAQPYKADLQFCWKPLTCS